MEREKSSQGDPCVDGHSVWALYISRASRISSFSWAFVLSRWLAGMSNLSLTAESNVCLHFYLKAPCYPAILPSLVSYPEVCMVIYCDPLGNSVCKISSRDKDMT